jgi:bile acid:Na+ symporter, BASS family
MKYLLPAAVFLLMLSIGMSLQPSELGRQWRRMHGVAWIRLLLATFIVPPAVALLLARWTHLNYVETAGLFMVGVLPGAPLTARNAAKKGFDLQLAAIYQIWGAVLTPVMIPLLVYGAAKLYERDAWIPPSVVLQQILLKQFVPLLIGMLLIYVGPAFWKKLRPAITITGNVMLGAMMVAVLWKMRATLAAITPWMVLDTVLLAAGSMLAIPLLLKAESETIKTLALCNASRHVGLALVLAGQELHSQGSLPTIACYAVVAPLAMFAYAKIFKREPLATATT